MRKLVYYAASISLLFLCVLGISAQDSQVTIEKKTDMGRPKHSKEIVRVGQSPAKLYRDIHPKFDSDSRQRSELRLFKRFEGESINTTKTFDVEGAEMSISLNGRVESGKISLKLTLPNGKDYKDFDIDPTSNVNWFVRIDSTSQVPFTGRWTIQIKTDKAVGDYILKLSTK